MKNNEYIEISRDIENLLKSESTHTFLILIDILLRSNNETNSLKTSISKIARTFGLDEREVKKSLSRLRKKELIEIYKNQDDKNSLIIALRKRLPEDESDVLTTIASKSGNGYREYSVGCYIKVFDEDEEKHWLDRQYGYLEWDRYSNGHGGCSLYKVTAWMPLPKLYKG